MRIIVSDTTAITYLLQVGYIGLLPELFEKVYIPRAVQQELFRLEWQKTKLKDVEWLIVVDLQPADLLEVDLSLDDGETQAIVLALKTGADLLIIDEVAGRKIAVQNGITITGILGILVLAKRKGLITNVRPLVDQLLENGFRIGPGLLATVYKSVGE